MNSIINLNYHAISHFRDESVLEKPWAWAQNKKNERRA